MTGSAEQATSTAPTGSTFPDRACGASMPPWASSASEPVSTAAVIARSSRASDLGRAVTRRCTAAIDGTRARVRPDRPRRVPLQEDAPPLDGDGKDPLAGRFACAPAARRLAAMNDSIDDTGLAPDL